MSGNGEILPSQDTVKLDAAFSAAEKLELERIGRVMAEVMSLRREVEGKFEGIEKAIILKASEVEKHLVDLNHAHARAQEERTLVLPRETFEQFVKGFEDYKKGITRLLFSSVAAVGTIVAVVAWLAQ